MRINIDHPTNKPNFSIVRVGTLGIAFSYQTPIGYTRRNHWITRVNDWGPTTGKHLKELDFGRKDERIPGEQFEAQLSDAINWIMV